MAFLCNGMGAGGGSEVHNKKILIESTPSQITSCNSNAWQGERASHITDDVLRRLFLEKASVAENKNKQTRFRRSQGGYKLLFMTYVFT